LNERKREMEKTFTIHYGYRASGSNFQHHYKIRIMCEEDNVSEIARAVAKGEHADFCYVEGEDNYRLTICETIS
jgi:hypothetical protein